MLFLVIEKFHTPGGIDVYRRARDKGRMLPESVKYGASWVDVDYTRCFQIMEAASAAALEPWMDQWRDVMDFEIVPVRTSTEAARLIEPMSNAPQPTLGSYAVSVQRVAPRVIAATRSKVSGADLADEIPMLIGRVYAVAKERSITLDGQNVVVYRSRGVEMDVDAGVGLIGTLDGDSGVNRVQTPAGEAAVTTHVGEYGALGQAHAAVVEWCKTNGRELAGPCWEVYGHWAGDPSRRKTDVYYLLV